jgi:hypothetical protein
MSGRAAKRSLPEFTPGFPLHCHACTHLDKESLKVRKKWDCGLDGNELQAAMTHGLFFQHSAHFAHFCAEPIQPESLGKGHMQKSPVSTCRVKLRTASPRFPVN